MKKTTPRRPRKQAGAMFIMAGAVAAVMVLAAILAVAQHNTITTQTCTVAGKFVTTSTGKPPQRIYQVETEQCGVLRVEDNLWKGIWNSADLFAAVHEGKTYEITTYGWRIPWASQFPHIQKVSPK